MKKTRTRQNRKSRGHPGEAFVEAEDQRLNADFEFEHGLGDEVGGEGLLPMELRMALMRS